MCITVPFCKGNRKDLYRLFLYVECFKNVGNMILKMNKNMKAKK